MEGTVNIHIEKLPEGVYLATSKDVQGLVAQGKTVAEALEVAKELAQLLLEAQGKSPASIKRVSDKFDIPLVISL